jgi:hypothetical protein
MKTKDAVETFTHGNRQVEIHFDPDPISPRENDNLVVLACWHRNLRLGDRQLFGRVSEEVIRAEVAEESDEVLAILPLYLYQHSGVTMRTTPFGDRWDSGQVGWAYVTKSGAEKMGCVGERHDRDGKVIGMWDREALEESIRGEVKEYDDFLTGQVFGYIIRGIDGEEIDSCWGFVGDMDYVRAEAKSAAEHSRDPAIEENAEELAARATFAAGGHCG